MFENPRRSRQARNFTTNVPKILDLKSSSEQIFFRKLSLGAPVYRTLTIQNTDHTERIPYNTILQILCKNESINSVGTNIINKYVVLKFVSMKEN